MPWRQGTSFLRISEKIKKAGTVQTLSGRTCVSTGLFFAGNLMNCLRFIVSALPVALAYGWCQNLRITDKLLESEAESKHVGVGNDLRPKNNYYIPKKSIYSIPNSV